MTGVTGVFLLNTLGGTIFCLWGNFPQSSPKKFRSFYLDQEGGEGMSRLLHFHGSKLSPNNPVMGRD